MTTDRQVHDTHRRQNPAGMKGKAASTPPAAACRGGSAVLLPPLRLQVVS